MAGSPSEGPACRVRLSQGPACQVRRIAFDHPSRCRGHDKHAPPNCRLEGPACQVRRGTLDHPSRYDGHDERVPPNFCADRDARHDFNLRGEPAWDRRCGTP